MACATCWLPYPASKGLTELSSAEPDYLFLVLLAVATVTASQAVGIFWSSHCSSPLLVARTFEHAMILSAAFGVTAAVCTPPAT